MNNDLYIKNKTTIKRVCLSVDTLFRNNYNSTVSTDFAYALPKPIYNVVSMKVTSVELPNFWYLFSQKNRSNEFTITVCNFIEYNENTNVSTVIKSRTHKIVIPEGNYYDKDLINYLGSYFNNTKGGLEFIVFDINTNNGKSIFRARHKLDNPLLPSAYDSSTPYYSPTFYYTVDFKLPDIERPLYLNMGWTLGFKQATYIVTNSNTYTNPFIYNDDGIITFNAYLISEGTYGNSLQEYLFLDIDDYNRSFSNDSIISCLTGSYLEGNNILARITVNTNPNSINFTNGSDAVFKKRQYFGPVTIGGFYIRILDKHGNVLNMNGNDFSFFIEMEVLNK